MSKKVNAYNSVCSRAATGCPIALRGPVISCIEMAEVAAGAAGCGWTPKAQCCCHSATQPSIVRWPRCAPAEYPLTMALTTVLFFLSQQSTTDQNETSPVVPDSDHLPLRYQIHRIPALVGPAWLVPHGGQAPEFRVVSRVDCVGNHVLGGHVGRWEHKCHGPLTPNEKCKSP